MSQYWSATPARGEQLRRAQQPPDASSTNRSNSASRRPAPEDLTTDQTQRAPRRFFTTTASGTRDRGQPALIPGHAAGPRPSAAGLILAAVSMREKRRVEAQAGHVSVVATEAGEEAVPGPR